MVLDLETEKGSWVLEELGEKFHIIAEYYLEKVLQTYSALLNAEQMLLSPPVSSISVLAIVQPSSKGVREVAAI
jgi:hypothetical protein